MSHLTILVQAQHFEIWDPLLYARPRRLTVLRAQEELAKSLENGRGKNIAPLDAIFVLGLTLLQIEISMLQVVKER